MMEDMLKAEGNKVGGSWTSVWKVPDLQVHIQDWQEG